MVTIVVLIILATISINAVFGENGIIKRAEAAKRLHEQGVIDEQTGLNELDKYLGDKLNGVPEIPVIPQTPKGPNGKPLINKDTVNKTEHEKIVGEDKLGNQVVVPNGFKISEESGDNVEDGIIIEDAIGNQFVWVPVSNIDGDGVVENQKAAGLISKKDGSKVQITLGRYSFDSTWNSETNTVEGTGKATLVQKGSEYAAIANEGNLNEAYKIKGHGDYYHYEFSVFRESNYRTDKDGENKGTNTTAKNLSEFMTSIQNHHGYYIARYEASFGSGDNIDNYKPLSQESISNSISSMNYTKGTLWNFVNQGDAAKVSRNMYAENSYVESDLVNSYMWDTAIVYIEAMGHENYASANRDTTGNQSLLNTGKTGDEKCHIYDMAGNLCEWTTEYCSNISDIYTGPCTIRSGLFANSGDYTARRYGHNATFGNQDITFRIGLYIK